MEREDALFIARQLRTPLDARGNAATAARYLKGGYQQDGYGVEEGAANDGSFAEGAEGNQGYYVTGGREAFLKVVQDMQHFFKRRAARTGKPVRYVIKTGIGGQHTPFQGIADLFAVVDPKRGKVAGEYELGRNFEAVLKRELRSLRAGWDQLTVVPSSKSGSTDETMMVFVDILYALLKNIAAKKGVRRADIFADTVLRTLHEVNFVRVVPAGEKERPGRELFSLDAAAHGTKSLPELVRRNAEHAGLEISLKQVKDIFAVVLGGMFFETTDRVDQSRLSAFIRNSGLDRELGERGRPGFGAMFDNVGGRWTGDLHMMTFLAFYFDNLEAAKAYWDARHRGVQEVREGRHVANELGDLILDKNITDIALVVPEKMFWFGKAEEQNFNESIWQRGFANLVTVPQGRWKTQAAHYAGRKDRLVINLSSLHISGGEFNVFPLGKRLALPADLGSLSKRDLALLFADLFTTFYGMTNTVGNRLIARAVRAEGQLPERADISDLDNPATRIVQQNLFLRQPYVELGKGLLQGRLEELQRREVKQPGAIGAAVEAVLAAAREKRVETNLTEVPLPPAGKIANSAQLLALVRQAREWAAKENRKFVPFLYIEGANYRRLRDHLIRAGVEWVMQGTGDQHISYQQVLAQPQRFLPFIISFFPGKPLPGRPAVGFAKGYLDRVSPNLVRDYFAEASYQALTDLRAKEGGRGFFLRLRDTEADRKWLKSAFKAEKSGTKSRPRQQSNSV